MATLRTSEINISAENNIVAHCPHCSKMYATTDDQGRTAGMPTQCQRCGCPMDNDKSAKAFMDAQAEDNHNPGLAAIGAKTRAMTDPIAHTAMIGNDHQRNK